MFTQKKPYFEPAATYKMLLNRVRLGLTGLHDYMSKVTLCWIILSVTIKLHYCWQTVHHQSKSNLSVCQCFILCILCLKESKDFSVNLFTWTKYILSSFHLIISSFHLILFHQQLGPSFFASGISSITSLIALKIFKSYLSPWSWRFNSLACKSANFCLSPCKYPCHACPT